jgi:hypothetical protein
LIVGGVGLDELFLLFGHLVQREDRAGGAHRNAGAAINAIGRMNVEVRHFLKPRLVLSRMNAVYRADLDAFFVLGAGVNDDVSHSLFLPDDSKRLNLLSTLE